MSDTLPIILRVQGHCGGLRVPIRDSHVAAAQGPGARVFQFSQHDVLRKAFA